jgi:hypothetical protein
VLCLLSTWHLQEHLALADGVADMRHSALAVATAVAEGQAAAAARPAVLSRFRRRASLTSPVPSLSLSLVHPADDIGAGWPALLLLLLLLLLR